MAAQNEDEALKEKFSKLAQAMRGSEDKINQELLDAQGDAVDIGGYFHPDISKASTAMRPSATLNQIMTCLPSEEYIVVVGGNPYIGRPG